MKSPRTNPKSETAFTLLEVVLAMAILGIMMTIAYASLSSILKSKALLDDRREARIMLNTLVQRITHELQLSFTQVSLMPPRDDLAKRYGQKIVLIGEQGDALETGLAGDSITFIALEGGQYLPDGGHQAGLVQLSYKIMEDPNVSQGTGLKSYALVRSEVPYIRPFKKAYTREMIFPLTSQVVGFEIRYLTQNDPTWVETWGSEGREGLPRMIRFSLSLRSPGGEITTATTAVPLRGG